MHEGDAGIQRLLDLARQGDVAAQGALLQHFRPKLKARVEQDLGPALLQRVDGSDVVQQTCIAALKAFHEFRGTLIPQFVEWLDRIHQHVISNTIRFHANTDKRAVSREVTGNAIEPIGRATTPSQKVIQQEDQAALNNLLGQLSALQQTAVRLRYSENLKVSQIAAQMQIPESRVRGLITNAIEVLRGRLGER